MFTVTDTAAKGTTLLDFPAPAGRVVGAAFDDALETNPVPLFMQSMELNSARQAGYRMSKDEADAESKRQGVDVKVGEDGITLPAFNILAERRRDDAARQLLMARSPGGVATVGGIGAGFAGALMDPVNVATGFIPVLGGTRYAAMLGEAATVGSRAAIRAGVGAAEGAVGAAATELPTLALRRDLQDDYSLYDSLANIAFGTFASAGIRGVSGAARDAWLGMARARELDALRGVDPSVWAKMRAQAASGEERAFWGDLEQGFQRGEGIPPELAQQMSTKRWQDLADVAIERRAARDRDKMLAAGIEPDEQLAASMRPETRLLSPAEIGDRILRQSGLENIRAMIDRGEGLVIVPRTNAEIQAAISPETHANALRAAVAQAVDGRQIDVSPVLRTDPAFGAQRIDLSEARSLARANQDPAAKVGADREASARASESIEKPEAAPAPKAQPPKAVVEKSPELIEAEGLLADTRAKLEAAAKEAGIELPAPEKFTRAEDYDRAWRSLIQCAEGAGL